VIEFTAPIMQLIVVSLICVEVRLSLKVFETAHNTFTLGSRIRRAPTALTADDGLMCSFIRATMTK